MPSSKSATRRTGTTAELAERAHVAALRTALLAWPDVSVQTKLGNASFQTRDKVFAFTRPEGVAMKLPEPRICALLEECEAEFLVMGKRTMREWMLLKLPDTDKIAARDLKLLREAKQFVGQQKA